MDYDVKELKLITGDNGARLYETSFKDLEDLNRYLKKKIYNNKLKSLLLLQLQCTWSVLYSKLIFFLPLLENLGCPIVIRSLMGNDWEGKRLLEAHSYFVFATKGR